MTIAELILIFAAGALLYYFLRPLQRRLEAAFRRALQGKKRGSSSVIDITDYAKKDNKPK
jgi:predicted PurR-regulated permease PerM